MDLIGYVTLEEATHYIETHYLSSDKLRESWESLGDADKTVLLTQSFQAIELLPFPGRKFDPKQSTAFPRWPQKEIPREIKWAQIENALAKSDSDHEEDAKHYERLWMYGVESYSIGNLTEHTSSGSYRAGGAQVTGITSAVADRLLKNLLGGGYRL